MKFIKIVENEITKVILDLEEVTIPAYELTSEDTVCTFEGTHDFKGFASAQIDKRKDTVKTIFEAKINVLSKKV